MAAAHVPVLDEAQLKGLCGSRIFERAESYYRSDAVRRRMIENGALIAEVEGTQETPYEVFVTAQNDDLNVYCDCPSDERFCKHVVALLIAWVRNPRSFETANNRRTQSDAESADDVTPLTELQGMLEMRTIADLRQIAKRRGLPVKGNSKADVVAQLAAGLLDPAGLAEAIERTDATDKVILDVVYLLNPGQYIGATQVQAKIEKLGLAGLSAEAKLAELSDSGLVAAGPKDFGAVGYCLPRGMLAQLPPAEFLAQRADSAKRGPVKQPRLLPPDELLFVIWRYLKDHPTATRSQDERILVEQTAESLKGWHNAADEVAALRNSSNWQYRATPMTTLAPLPELSDRDLDELARRAGVERDAVEFGCSMLRDLGMVSGKDRLTAREAEIRAFLTNPRSLRLKQMAEAWLYSTRSSELMLALRHDQQLRMRRTLGAYGSSLRPEAFFERLAVSRRLVVNALGRLAEEVWYTLPSFEQAIHRLAGESFADFRQIGPGDWWLERPPGARLDPGKCENWRLGYGRLIDEVLRGPLAWLGVATVTGSGPDTVFRLKGLRAMLGLAEPPPEEVRPLKVNADLSVVVPPASGGLEVHDFLMTIAAPLEATPRGLSYRLTPTAACAAFSQGLNVSTIIAFLHHTSDGHLPPTVVRQLENWWDRYGKLRLYSDLCLIELADDYTLPELLAGTSLSSKILFQFSPRVAAVRNDAVAGLVAELKRKGYTPKVLSGAEAGDAAK